MQSSKFNDLANKLLENAKEHLEKWLPNGQYNGNEYELGSLKGETGHSLKIHSLSGKWSDFETGEAGGDLISLYAAINKITQGEAYNLLCGSKELLTKPPKPTPHINMYHPQLDAPTNVYEYKDQNGDTLFFVARYFADYTQKKEFLPFSWDQSKGKWIKKAWPQKRPIYNLHKLNQLRNDQTIVVVEGEKACDAANTHLSNEPFLAVTWQGGANALSKTDFSPLLKRKNKIILWPDADAPGVKASIKLAQSVATATELSIVGVSDLPKGHDCADLSKTEILERLKNAQKYSDWVKRPEVIERYGKELGIIQNIKGAPEDAPKTIAELAQNKNLMVSQNGAIIPNSHNYYALFCIYFKNLIYFDEFHQKYLTKWDIDDDDNLFNGPEREWRDIDEIRLARVFERKFSLRSVSKDTMHSTVIDYASKNRKNAPKDWIESLEWDGQSRVDNFFTRAFGASCDVYSSQASQNFWVSIIARIFTPGCKVDNMIILEGIQGAFKSSALRAIAGAEYFAELSESVESKDFFLKLQGKFLLEIAELDAFSKGEITRIKSVITTQVDRFRPPYGKNMIDFPRRCIFVGTTNEDEYLKDHTGGRRFWPIRCGEIDLDYIRENREQFFAEALVMFKEGFTWYKMPKEITEEIQEARRDVDIWEERVASYISQQQSICISDILEFCIKLDIDRHTQREKNRVARILKALGYSCRVFRVNGRPKRVYEKTVIPIKQNG